MELELLLAAASANASEAVEAFCLKGLASLVNQQPGSTCKTPLPCASLAGQPWEADLLPVQLDVSHPSRRFCRPVLEPYVPLALRDKTVDRPLFLHVEGLSGLNQLAVQL